MLRSWDSPFEAFPSHLAPTRCRVRDESRAVSHAFRRGCANARLPFANVQAVESNRGKSHPSRFLGFAPSENPTIARGFRPRAIRCSPRFSLSKEFPLPASIPSSRVIRSRTFAAGHYTVRLFPQRFACGKVSFPSPRPSISVESRVRDAALSEVSALVFRHEQRHAEPVR